MAAAQGQQDSAFFDVLIDRLIDDVRREFAAGRDPYAHDAVEETSAEPTSLNDDLTPRKRAPAAGYDDLVSKMIGFRARMATEAPTANLARYSGAAVPRFSTADIQYQISSAKPKTAEPHFQSSEAQIAFTLVVKAGARFLVSDMDDEGLTREALKRERRRVLLTLHPDRVPEADRGHAHQEFLKAAEAFETLTTALESERRFSGKAAA